MGEKAAATDLWLRARLRMRGDRRGAVLTLVGLALAGLVGVAALAIDLGMLFAADAEAQRAADAAALAGASAFIDFDPVTHPTEATNNARMRVYEYARLQGILNTWVDSADIVPTILIDEQKVRVLVRKDSIGMFFGRIFGHTLGSVTAQAAAEAVDAGASDCVKPFALPDMWTPTDPATVDIYDYQGGDAPTWDFDRHLFDSSPYDQSPYPPLVGSQNKPTPETWDGGTYVSAGDASHQESSWTGYGSPARDGALDWLGKNYKGDEGRRLPLKMNNPHMTMAPSYFFPWRMPGSSGGKDYENAIKGCVPASVSVGYEALTEDSVWTEPGNMLGPTQKGLQDLIDQQDADWVEEQDCSNGPCYWKGHVEDASGNTITEGPRVFTVPLIDPNSIDNGMTKMKFVGFAKVFLEDQDEVYLKVPKNVRPWTVRLMHYGYGQAGPVTGPLIKRLRLVE